MAHNLAFGATGKAAFAYVGEAAWHGLGQELQENATIEEWQIAAGMNFTIERGVVQYATSHDMDSPNWRAMPSKHVLMRSDNFNALGIVSDGYNIVQPAEVLEFFRDIAAQNGGSLHTAGVLFDGKRFWALAKMGPDSYVVDSSDGVRAYLLLVTSADGTLATEGRFVATRVVCNNTMQIAMNEKDGGGRAKVSHRSVFNERDMKEKLGLVAADSFEKTMEDFRKLAATKMNSDQMISNTIELFYPGTFDKDGKIQIDQPKFDKQLRAAPVQRVANMAVTGRDLIGADKKGMQGTGYGWINAVTQYYDHEARAHTPDNRLNSALFGDGARQKVRAMQMAMTHADGSVTYEEIEQEVAPPAPAPTSSNGLTDFAALLGGTQPTGPIGGGSGVNSDFAALLNR